MEASAPADGAGNLPASPAEDDGRRRDDPRRSPSPTEAADALPALGASKSDDGMFATKNHHQQAQSRSRTRHRSTRLLRDRGAPSLIPPIIRARRASAASATLRRRHIKPTRGRRTQAGCDTRHWATDLPTPTSPTAPKNGSTSVKMNGHYSDQREELRQPPRVTARPSGAAARPQYISDDDLRGELVEDPHADLYRRRSRRQRSWQAAAARRCGARYNAIVRNWRTQEMATTREVRLVLERAAMAPSRGDLTDDGTTSIWAARPYYYARGERDGERL